MIWLSPDPWTGLWERVKNGTKRKLWEDVLSPPKSRLKWMHEFCRQKGVEHALDHMCDSLNSVVVGISRWLCGWWTHSYPAGRCHHRRGDPSYSGTKTVVAIWTLAGEGEEFGEEVVNRSRRILPNLTIPKFWVTVEMLRRPQWITA